MKASTTLAWFLALMALWALLLVVSRSDEDAVQHQAQSRQPDPAPAEPAQPESPQAEPEQPLIRIRASELVAEYEANEVAADSRYKGRKLVVSGTVGSIRKDMRDTPFVTLDGGFFSFRGVQAFFDEKDLPLLSKLTKGQEVNIVGVCSGLMIEVLIKDSQILEAGSRREAHPQAQSEPAPQTPTPSEAPSSTQGMSDTVQKALDDLEDMQNHIDGEEKAAVRSIMAIHIGQAYYYSQHGEYAGSLAALGRPEQKQGYKFTLVATPDGYTINADPLVFGTSGSRTFYSDQTRTIHSNAGREPATETSPTFK